MTSQADTTSDFGHDVHSKNSSAASTTNQTGVTSYLTVWDARIRLLPVPSDHPALANNVRSSRTETDDNQEEAHDIDDEVTKFASVREVAFAAAGLPVVTESPHASPAALMFPMGRSITYPSTFPVMVTDHDVEKRLKKDLIYFTVYNKACYNFTAEFLHAYRGKSGKKNTAYGDTMTVVKRALQVADMSLSDEALTMTAAYVLRVATWELSIINEVCARTGFTAFPKLSPVFEVSKTRIQYAKLFIGTNDTTGELEVWIRMFQDIVNVGRDFTPPSNPATTNRPVKSLFRTVEECTAEVNSRGTSKLVYYRRYGLHPADIADQIRMESKRSLNDASKPQPPPRPPRSSDCMVYVIVRQDEPPGNAAGRNLPYLSSMIDFDDDDHVDNSEHVNTTGNSKTPSVTGSVRSKKSTKYELPPSSLCADLIGWGHNSCMSMGFREEANMEPRLIPVIPRLRVEGIKMIACSARHTLLLSGFGIVYSCGENSEGALGTSDFVSRSSFLPIYWPQETYSGEPVPVPPLIKKIAAGTATIGSHSMAIDEAGRLYAWGAGYCTGLSTTQPIAQPRQVRFDHIALEIELVTGIGQELQNEYEADETRPAPWDDDHDQRFRCKDVACGGAFTVVVLENGRVCSFGMWSHGRLGLGPTPYIDVRRRGRSTGSRKLARFQLRPALLSLKKAVSVSCGEVHSVCLLESGELRAWGQNSSGQLGIGVTSSGYLRDSVVPLPVNLQQSGAPEPQGLIRAVQVKCGSYHSLAIDQFGGCWSWGARGSACLGHGDPLLEGVWGNRVNSIFSSTSGRVMVPYELLSWCQSWTKPRLIERFPGDRSSMHEDDGYLGGLVELNPLKVTHVSAGDMHSAFVTTHGHLFLCGTGPVVPPLLPQSRLEELMEDGEVNDQREGSSDGPKSSDWKSVIATYTVSTPRRPSASWLPTYCNRRYVVISSGGTHCLAVVDDENVCATLTTPLIDRILYNKHSSGNSSAHSSHMSDTASMTSLLDSHGNHSAGYFESRGRADCIIVTSGKMLIAHRAVLAQRSPELRDMIMMETPAVFSNVNDEVLGSEGGIQSLVQILLPEFHINASKALLHFLYCDVLPIECIGDTALLQALIRAGKTLRIPRLQILCEHLLKVLVDMELTSIDDEGLNAHSGMNSNRASMSLTLELPPVTLARDLGSMVGDPQFADVRFVAEGRAIFAHRFILESRSEYFRAMFRSGMMESQLHDGSGMFGEAVDVVVPGTMT